MTTALERALALKVRHVRTPAGREKYGEPIGAVITRDVVARAARRASDGLSGGGGHPSSPQADSGPSTARTAPRTRIAHELTASERLAEHTAALKDQGRRRKTLRRGISEYQGWDRWVFGGQSFYVGQYEKGGKWYVTGKDDKELFTADTAGEAVQKLRSHLNIPLASTNIAHTEGFVPITTAEERAAFKEKWGALIPPGLHAVRAAMHDTPHNLIAVGIDGKGGIKRINKPEYMSEGQQEKWERIKRINDVIHNLDDGLAEKALTDDTAAVVLLMRKTGLRVGSSKEQRGSVPAFGASTLQFQHIKFNQDSVTLDFVGKEGVHQHYVIKDDELVAMFRARQDYIEQHLGNGRRTNEERATPVFPGTSSAKTIAYIKERLGRDTKNHDLRTYLATSLAYAQVRTWEKRPPKTKAEFRKRKNAIGDAVSKQLGNNRSQALTSYISPAVWADYQQEGW